MHLDRTEEAIAHFIGFFEVRFEQAWHLQSYTAFDVLPQPSSTPTLPDVPAPFSENYLLGDFEPGFIYRPSVSGLTPTTIRNEVGIALPDVPVPANTPGARWNHDLPGAGADTINYRITLPEVETLGSVAHLINQGIELSDNDYFGVGGHGLRFTPAPVDAAAAIGLYETARELTPLDGDALGEMPVDLEIFAAELAEALEGHEQEARDGQTVFVEKQTNIEGIYVDGIEADETPDLEEYFSLEDWLETDPHSDEPPAPNAILTDEGWEIDASVKVETGGNVLVNNVFLQNLWTASGVTAVMGNHIEINAIIQINAWSDNDTLTEAIAGWDQDPTQTQAFNIANFKRFDPAAETAEPNPEPAGGFPEHWVVKTVEGDLMIMNWLQQFTFMQDNDIGILSSSGATTAVYSGQNIAYNDISIYELGFSYDLIMIGGSCYDVNVIEQMNILFDDDLVGAMAGFQTGGSASYATSGNLLWNNAHIYNVGGASRFDALPDAYRDASNALAGGNDGLNDGVLSDPAFAGFGALRVLYITGDLINMQYARMTNILGDSDQIALAMNAHGGHLNADWSVMTGSNVLINNASILDLDSTGRTYVGGEQYSQDVLVQADIISTDPYFGTQDPDALVNEAVAFLTDDEMQTDEDDYGHAGNLDPENAHGDALQTLIG